MYAQKFCQVMRSPISSTQLVKFDQIGDTRARGPGMWPGLAITGFIHEFSVASVSHRQKYSDGRHILPKLKDPHCAAKLACLFRAHALVGT